MRLFKFNLKAFLLKMFPGLLAYRPVFRAVMEKILWPMRYMPGSSLAWGPPRGLYKDAISYNIRNPSKPIRELLLKDAAADNYKLPWSNSQVATSFFKNNINTEVIEKRAWFLKEARYIYGHSGTIITSDDKIFLPLSPADFYRTHKTHQSFYLTKLPKMAIFKKVILVDTFRADENNYCHWLRDHISRFFWLKKLDIDFSEYTLIATNGTAGFCESTRESLICGGFNFKEWLFTVDFRHFYADEIIVPPYVNVELKGGIFDIEEILFLRKFWLKPTISIVETYDKIYLSRRNATRRYTPAQAELAERLADYGVKEVFLENMTVFEQATMLNNATLIIGLHGAALTNLIFCKPGVTVIEIFGADQMVSHFWSIAEKLGLNYYAYCDDEFKGSNPYPWRHMAPTYMNVDNFFNCFTELNLL